ncbi:fungal pheromone STE3G-protein-coupled receptor [Peniophora sp. CONT]|nr:fungal pheromone STE3G-protein-coupled receptor [Peniophora sp. CONT]
MTAVDPTYPLYPIVCVLSAAMMLLLLLTGFIRHSCNTGVAFLCFWLFFENLTNGISAIVWADNADIKLHIYCDIASHVDVITFVAKPMATLIISRRLYLIANPQSVQLFDKAASRRNLVIEWTLGLAIPVLVAGPLYYIVQVDRFQVVEGFGCTNAIDGSVLSLLLIMSWSVIPPLVSVVVYYPRVLRVFYRQYRDTNYFGRNIDSVSRTSYIRILALASIDTLVTLPFGIATIVLSIANGMSRKFLSFYPGWAYDHADWPPESFSYADLKSFGTSTMVEQYFPSWTSPILAFVIFGLFGVTKEARTSYRHVICVICGGFGWKPTPQTLSPLGTLEFGERPQDTSFATNVAYVHTALVLRT